MWKPACTRLTEDAQSSFFVPEFFTLPLIWSFLLAVHSPSSSLGLLLLSNKIFS